MVVIFLKDVLSVQDAENADEEMPKKSIQNGVQPFSLIIHVMGLNVGEQLQKNGRILVVGQTVSLLEHGMKVLSGATQGGQKIFVKLTNFGDEQLLGLGGDHFSKDIVEGGTRAVEQKFLLLFGTTADGRIANVNFASLKWKKQSKLIKMKSFFCH